ncbi:PhzF family phenazine biosynthesis protein [Dyella sp.]|uniref:PhzF family phenazine biosynthesis protein n=1 Tax=Dyella sp. TaxID=1869338 RepID=UPI002ED60B97
MAQRPFKQVDVFTRNAFKGNPLAVVLNGEGLSDEAMQSIARWTNLSETTFVIPAPVPEADYAVRIFTTDGEFLFAGHPTLGTAHALLEAGLRPRTPGRLVQHCGVGLVNIEVGDDGVLAFQAPPVQIDIFDESLRDLLSRAIGTRAWLAQVPAASVTMGNRWLVVGLADARACLNVAIDVAALQELLARSEHHGLAVFGLHDAGATEDIEVRTFLVEQGSFVEDPITGSANGCIAWLLEAHGVMGHAAGRSAYLARQGTRIHRDGQVLVSYRGQTPWIGGHCTTLIQGVIDADAA